MLLTIAILCFFALVVAWVLLPASPPAASEPVAAEAALSDPLTA